ncbi:uncharacterized protein LOC130976855 isoform X2 [Arachis stenosperma]|uniref:uncharacterized protein LOC130976855 isoform X2 n=1 Tax=Arachis stenosperma TaxID=217475 RepID=UPI0025AB6262|nr:uncharacterized protein LOC130976855 isoform X2 [Arachis stenosperma]
MQCHSAMATTSFNTRCPYYSLSLFLLPLLMDSEDQRITQIQGNENHGVHVCNKCGWPFPNPHPSAKHRRAHKKNCGTIEGYKLLVSEGQTLNPSDDEHFSDNDHKTQEESPSISKSRNDIVAQTPKILQSERNDDCNLLELQDLKTDDSFALTSDSTTCRSEAMSDVLLDNKIYVDGTKETTLKEKDEIKPDRDTFEIVESSDSTIGRTFEGVSGAVTEVVSLKSQVTDGTFILKKNNGSGFPSVMPQEDLFLEAYSAQSMNDSIDGIQVDSEHMTELATSGDIMISREREEVNVDMLTFPSCDDRPDVAHPQIEYECHEPVVSQNSASLHLSKALEQGHDGLKDSVTEENDFLINQGQLSKKGDCLSQDMHSLNSNMKKQVNCELMAAEMHSEECIEVFNGESNRRLHETGAFMNDMKTEKNGNHVVHFSEEQVSNDAHKNSQQIDVPKGSLMAASDENACDASFVSASSQTTAVIIRDTTHHDGNITSIAVDDECRRANIENDTGICMNILQSSNVLSEINSSSICNEYGVEMGKFEQSDIVDAQHAESGIVKDATLPDIFESTILSEVVIDGPKGTPKDIECSNRSPLSCTHEEIKEEEINSIDRSNEYSNIVASTSAASHQTQDEELLLKATEGIDLIEDSNRTGRDHSLNIEPSYQCVSPVEDTQDGQHGTKVPGVVAVPIQDQRDLPVQSDVQATNEAEAIASTDLSMSTETEKSNLKYPEASEEQQYEKSEMFEPPSFMTLVEPGLMLGPKSAPEVETDPNKQKPDSNSSQAAWFPTLTHNANESEGRKRNEEIIAKVTRKQNTPLKSLLVEAAHNSKKSKSPKSEKDSVNQKHVRVTEDNGSGLTTVNSILGCESPAMQIMNRESTEEWNSSDDITRKKKKDKSRSHWIQLLCCSSVETR